MFRTETPDTAKCIHISNGSKADTVPSSAGAFHPCAFQVFADDSEQLLSKSRNYFLAYANQNQKIVPTTLGRELTLDSESKDPYGHITIVGF